MDKQVPKSDVSYNVNDVSKCPFHNGTLKTGHSGSGTGNQDWWPHQLKLNILRQHSSLTNPMDADFDYKKAFESLDYKALKKTSKN